MEDLLYLVHRIPYPPNKGDKIRSFNVLKYLSERYRVHLAAFVDDPADHKFSANLDPYVESSFFVPINPTYRRGKALSAIVRGKSLSDVFYESRPMKAYVDTIVRDHCPSIIMTFSSTMSQFVPSTVKADTRVVADFVDMDSMKWKRYSEEKSWPMSILYRMEAQRLATSERLASLRFDHTLFVTKSEANLYSDQNPDVESSVRVLENGVDTEYFNASLSFESPYDEAENVVVFTGAMDYWANVDAVRWFATEVWEQIVKVHPSAMFYIVGMKPTRSVLALANNPNIKVTGAVPDVRPYLAHAACVVAPLRIARGIQNKVLEAMSMARPVCASLEALEGIELPTELKESMEFANAGEAAEMVTKRLRVDTVSEQALRDFVIERYGWSAQLRGLDDILARPFATGPK